MSVTIPGDAIAISGLFLDVLGVALLFWIAPEKYPDPQSLSSFAIDSRFREKWSRKQKLRKWLAYASLIFIISGFLIQGIAIALF